ncbi:uncharacterized protein ACBT44_001186 [Syngnathus typhle]
MDVFTDIFNTSLQQANLPSRFKAATIVPVPEKPAPSCFNDYRPVALPPIIMKMFVDYSSAFNTIVPQRLISKLDKLGLSPYLCNWLLDFLCQRPQVVRVDDKISASITLSTGPSQGCVLSPLLFTLLTHDCIATHSDNRIVKFADDTTLVGLITKGDETQYRLEVDLLTTWCRDNNLLLNVDKTKEVVVDFRKGHSILQAVRILNSLPLSA